MFWRNKQSSNWILVFFGLIAAGIIVAIAVLIMLLFLRRPVVQESLRSIQEQGSVAVIGTSPEEVKNTYVSTIKKLREDLDAQEVSSEEVMSKTKGTLLRVRVPKELLDQHLNVFLAVQKMEAEGVTPEEKTELLRLLGELMSGDSL